MNPARQWLGKARLAVFLGKTMIAEGRPSCLINFDGGIGDDLLCTAIFRELRKRGQGRRLWMMSGYPELFEENDDIDHVVPHQPRYISLAKKTGRVILPNYNSYHTETDTMVPPQQHIITCMCAQAGVTGDIHRRPYLSLRKDEIAKGRLHPQQIAIQTSGMSARFPMKNKQWFPERFQSVVDRLKEKYHFVQIGDRTDPVLQDVVDLRGKTSVRETAAILHGSLVFVGLVGLLMHLARAVECRAVIVYGGREPARLTGYTCNENIETDPPCSPCWRYNTCAYDRQCMTMIHPDVVAEAILRQTLRKGEPLAEDLVTIG